MRRARQTTPTTVGIYVLVIVSLQLFLVMVALDALITYQARLAWGAAATSAVLWAMSAALYRYLRQAARVEEEAPTRAVRRAPR